MILTSETASRLLSDPNLRIMVYGAADNGLTHYSPSDIAFPHQVELKVNHDDVKANLRGLKNKPGTTRPADITNFIRKKVGYVNTVTMTYALTQKVVPYSSHANRSQIANINTRNSSLSLTSCKSILWKNWLPSSRSEKQSLLSKWSGRVSFTQVVCLPLKLCGQNLTTVYSTDQCPGCGYCDNVSRNVTKMSALNSPDFGSMSHLTLHT